ncbi:MULTISPECIES: baseplate hub domain-containing protein [unclassified Bradyrhizobium]|uniref:baseplate hub domain-containing protein n=1 Tax=Bradyrhizobium sp. USDA 4541 TaxID=2817704 RepID=UPI0020A5A1FB|nr:DUF2163 domain-containing protein [Bradyrhizobium sp. USDA 4541]MCP1852108.1 hypothetical protein [Bradyrhizobium sp. USDA 4541]
MRTYSFDFRNARPAFLFTITRTDGVVIRVTSYVRPITIAGVTWQPGGLLQVGDNTETNSGDPPTMSFKVVMRDDGLFTKLDIANRKFDGAYALVEVTNAKNPTTKDYEFDGLLKGDVSFDRYGNAEFEILNKFALQRDVFVRKYSIQDDVDFGDPRRSKVATFPTVDVTSQDLSDVARSATLTVGDRRRFRYGSAGNPSDYHNVYWEVTAVSGPTGAAAPVSPSDTIDASVTDGGVTFTVRNAWARAFQVASIVDERHITIAVTEPRAGGDTSWFAPGLLVMRSGHCTNRASDIDAWDGTSQIEIVVPFGHLLQVGDWGEIAPDL